MHLWRFYKKPKDPTKEFKHIEDKYSLYAFTNNKKYAKEFMRLRNMDRFIVRESDDIEPEEYADYCNTNRPSHLQYEKIRTANNKFTSKQEVVNIDVLMTQMEYDMLEGEFNPLTDQSTWDAMPNPFLFQPKVFKILEDLDYVSQYKLMNSGYNSFVSTHSFADDDYSAPDISFDTMMIFIYMFGDTFK